MNPQKSEPRTSEPISPFDIFKPEWEIDRKSLHLDSLIVKHDIEPPDTLLVPPITHHMMMLQLSHGSKQLTRIGNKEYSGSFSSGEFFLHPANTSGLYSWSTTDEAVVFIIKPTFLSRIAEETECLNRDRIELSPILCDRDSNIEYIARSFLYEMQNEGLGGKLYSETLATQLGIHLLRKYCAFPIKLKQYSGGLSRRKLQGAIDYIQANLESKVSLDDLAKVTNTSSYHFCRLFKKSTGITPYQYLIRCRIDRAKILLRQGKLSIADIALEVGFSNQSHFTKHFKRLVGTTPKKFLV